MAILLIIIAIILFFIAWALYKIADNKQENPAMSPNSSPLPLFQSLSYNEKLNIMCLLFYFGGFAKTDEEHIKSRYIVSRVAKDLQIDLQNVTNYVLSRSELDEKSLMPSVINVISSISDRKVKEIVLVVSFKICSCIQSTNVTSELLSVANQLGFSKHELLSLVSNPNIKNY